MLIALAIHMISCSPKITEKTQEKAITVSKDSLLQNSSFEGIVPALTDEIPKKYIINEIQDSIANDNLQTVLIYKTGWEMSLPVINLNTNESITFSFDDLEGDVKRYKYTILQCDANWQYSQLLPSQYIDGFTEDYIADYKLSFNTIQK